MGALFPLHMCILIVCVCCRQPDGQRISVCVRKRPLTHAECRRGESDVVTTPSGECVTVHESKEAVDLTQYILQVDIVSREETMTDQCFVMHLFCVYNFCFMRSIEGLQRHALPLVFLSLQHRFYFDHVFGEESSNEEVYRKTAYPLVQHMLNG